MRQIDFALNSRRSRSSLRSVTLGGKNKWEWLPLQEATGCHVRSSAITIGALHELEDQARGM